MITFDKITEIFCIVDEFCKEFERETEHFLIGNKPKRPPRMSSAEVITISLLFHLSGFRCFKHFYIFYVQKHMQSEFPETVSYNRFTELMQSKLMLMTMFAKTCCLGSCTGISFVDSTPIRVCKNKRIKRNKVFQDLATKEIGVNPSTIYREINRNKNKNGGYSSRLAHEMAEERKERLPGNRSTDEWVKQKVIKLIRKEWSPRQISGYLSKHGDIDISHETIYRWIRQDKKEGGNLYTHCRHKLKHRKRPVGASAKNIPNQRDISQRPKEAEGADLETLKWIQ